jgi:hypothetical protein
MQRKLIPFLVAATASAIVAAGILLLDLTSSAAAGLTGFVGGLLLAWGVLFAFGEDSLRQGDPEGWKEVKAKEPTVAAYESGTCVAFSYDEVRAIAHRLEKNQVGGVEPVFISAHGAIRFGSLRLKGLGDLASVH